MKWLGAMRAALVGQRIPVQVTLGLVAALLAMGPLPASASSAGAGVLVVVSKPARGDVRVDGVDAGTSAPATFIALRPGPHRVTVVIPGFKRWESNVEVKAGVTTSVDAKLSVALPAKVDAEVRVTTTSDRIDGDASNLAALKARPGADGISLREAMTAANGTSGTKVIRFARRLAGAVMVVGSATGRPLPQLRSGSTWVLGDINEDGRPDITLDGRLTKPSPWPHEYGLSIWSRGNVVSGLRLVRFENGVFLAPPRDWRGRTMRLSDNKLLGNSIEAVTNGVMVGPLGLLGIEEQTRISHLAWRRLTIAGNSIAARDAGVFMYAGSGTSHDNLIADVVVASNQIDAGVALGVVGGDADSAYHGSSGPLRYADRNAVQGLTVAHNRCNAVSKGIEVSAANMGNRKCAISDVAIRDNDITTVSQFGIGLDAGVPAMGRGERATAHGSLRHVVVRRNRTIGGRFGILACASDNSWNASASPRAGGAAHNVTSDVVIIDNRIEGPSECGILAAAGFVSMGASPSRDTTLVGLTISRNAISSGRTQGTGIRLAAGVAAASAHSTGNCAKDIVLEHNVVRGFQRGIWIAGGQGPGAASNVLSGRSSGNSVCSEQPWLVSADSVDATGNTLTFDAKELKPLPGVRVAHLRAEEAGLLGIALAIVVSTSIWVFTDVRKIAVAEQRDCGLRLTSPSRWTIGCLLLWVVVLPLYLHRRRRLHRRSAADLQDAVAESRKRTASDSFDFWS
jgi:hypothetical protein